jgi:hypothetical protein
MSSQDWPLKRCAVSKKPRRDQKHRPQHAEASQQPAVERSESPRNTDGARPKMLCKFHPGKVINKVRPFPIPEHAGQKTDTSLTTEVDMLR